MPNFLGMGNSGKLLFPGEKQYEGLGDWYSSKLALRIGQIEEINETGWYMTINWLDHPGGRTKVPITQSNWGFYSCPVKDSIIICGFNTAEELFILRYITPGYPEQVTTQKVRQVHSGEQLIKSYGGSDILGSEIFMNKKGDIELKTAFGEYIRLVREESLLEHLTRNWKARTEAGELFMGVLQRPFIDPTTGETEDTPVLKNVALPIDVGNNVLTETHLKIIETSDDDLGLQESDTPMLECILGTEVNDLRQKVSFSGLPPSPVTARSDQIAVHFLLRDEKILANPFPITKYDFKLSKAGSVKYDIKGSYEKTISLGETVNITGGSKKTIIGNVSDSITGTYTITTTGKIELESITDIVLKSGAVGNVKIGGDNSQVQSLLTDSFGTTVFDTHVHIGNLGIPTVIPVIPYTTFSAAAEASPSVTNVKTYNTKAQ